MSRTVITCALALALLAAGCATPAQKVQGTKAAGEVPEAAAGEVAVFGGISIVEEIGIFMPNEDQDGHIYLKPEAGGPTIRISCSDSGEFGVYLPPGRYGVDEVDVDGYTFRPHIRLDVYEGFKALYAGTIELDGTPAGVDPETGDTIFVYSIIDRSREFMDVLRRQAPGSEREVAKSLFVADGAVSTGSYPVKVFRAADLKSDLQARSGAVEEVVSGGIVALTYIINPVWLFAIH